MKKVLGRITFWFIVFGIIVVIYNLSGQDFKDGRTVESREAILRDLPIGTHLNIAQEQYINDYLLSCVYSDSQAGIAVFEPNGRGKYKLVSMECRDADDIVISGCFIPNKENREWYDFIWFNGAPTSYAEITYSTDGAEDKSLYFDTSDTQLICLKAPAKNYSIEVKYYDSDGNIY